MAKKLQQQLGGRQTRADTLHLTLVFIGDVPRKVIPDLIDALAEVALSSFEIDFDHADYWAHNRIACLTTTTPPTGLLTLVRTLEHCLDHLAIPFDRRTYKPHITLVRHAVNKPNPDEDLSAGNGEPVHWSATEFLLVESQPDWTGARYHDLARFPLGPASASQVQMPL